MDDRTNTPDLEHLFSAACDESLTDDERKLLDSALAADTATQDAYLAFFRLHADIRMHVQSRRSIESALLAVIQREEATEPAERARKEGEGGSVGEDTSSGLSASSDASSPTLRSKSWLDRASRRPVRPALAVAALVMISVVAWMGVTMVKTQIAGGGKKGTDERQKIKKPEFVAWLMKAHKTQWLDGTKPQKTKLMPGQRLAIAKGLIEIQYRTRAVVVIEGPAVFYVGARDSGLGAGGKKAQTSAPSPQPLDPKSVANSGFLALGSLVARVEGEKAQGFTIDTPTGRVEDHGTEFGVEVDDGGTAEVVVLAGKVDLVGAVGSLKGRRLTLVANQGAIVGRDGKFSRMEKVSAKLLAGFRRQLVTMETTSVGARSPGSLVGDTVTANGSLFALPAGVDDRALVGTRAEFVGRLFSIDVGASSVRLDLMADTSQNIGTGSFTLSDLDWVGAPRVIIGIKNFTHRGNPVTVDDVTFTSDTVTVDFSGNWKYGGLLYFELVTEQIGKRHRQVDQRDREAKLEKTGAGVKTAL